jgi:hypothetical protein
MKMKGAFKQGLNGVHRFLRVTGLAVLFVWCAAFSCYQIESDIQYAPGYGYVIHVTCKNYCESFVYPKSYLIFDTYEGAADWLRKFQSDGQAMGTGINYRTAPQADYPDIDGLTLYQKIAKLAGPPPNTYPADIQLNQPEPYVPQ